MIRKVKSLEELKSIGTECYNWIDYADNTPSFIISAMSKYCETEIELGDNSIYGNYTFSEWMLEPITVEQTGQLYYNEDIPTFNIIQGPDTLYFKIHEDGTPELLVSYEEALDKFKSSYELSMYLPVLKLAKKYLDLLEIELADYDIVNEVLHDVDTWRVYYKGVRLCQFSTRDKAVEYALNDKKIRK